MEKAKYLHVLELGNPNKNTKNCYIYKYGRTEGIRILDSQRGIRIEACLGKKYSGESMISYQGYHLFPDAIKKGLLIHILRYQNSMEIGEIHAWAGRVQADGTVELAECTLPEDRGDFVQMLFTGALKRPLYQTLDNPWMNGEVLDTILSSTKTKQGCRFASLYALLTSKTKIHPAERFIYLWMSFNGLYDYISIIVKNMLPQNKKRELKKRSDAESIADLMSIADLGSDRVVQKDSERIAREVISLIDNSAITLPVTKASLESGNHRELNESLERILRDENNINLSGYGYLLLYFAYYFRCNIIHANNPLPLFCYGNEYETRCLRIINQLLEEFLEVELPKYYRNSFINETLTPKIEKCIRDEKIR